MIPSNVDIEKCKWPQSGVNGQEADTAFVYATNLQMRLTVDAVICMYQILVGFQRLPPFYMYDGGLIGNSSDVSIEKGELRRLT